MTSDWYSYGDESGQELGDACCVLGGFVAPLAQWESFNAEWQRVLRKAEVPEFHAQKFFSRQSAKGSSSNPYAGMDEQRARRFLDGILRVICDHRRVIPIGSAIDTKEFFSLSWGERNFLTGAEWNSATGRFVSTGAPKRTYHVPFFSLVGEALINAKPADAKVQFVMDENKVIQNGIQALYARSRNSSLLDINLRDKMGDLIPGLSHDHEGIQAADLLAHIWFSYYSRDRRLSGERNHAFMAIGTAKHWEMGMIHTRGMLDVLAKNLSTESWGKIKALVSPQARQPQKMKLPWPPVEPSTADQTPSCSH